MSRLLALSGEFVATKHSCFHITAYDPASGLYIGMGHAPASKDKVVGDIPQACVGFKVPGHDTGFVPTKRERHPLFGPIILQNSCGVCGVMGGRMRSGVCETGMARIGQAWIVTDILDLLSVAESGFSMSINDLLMDVPIQRTTAIPIQITALRHRSGIGFSFSENATMPGLSGAPIIQDGRIVGAVYGDGVGRDIAQMVANLLGNEVLDMGRGTRGSNKSNHHGGQGTGWNGGGAQGSGRRVARSASSGIWKNGVHRCQYGNFVGKIQSAHAMYRALNREAPRIASLEAQVRRYEAGSISQGILYQGHKVTYDEALKRIWAYHQARLRLAVHSYVYAGVITEGQYREIVRCSLCEV